MPTEDEKEISFEKVESGDGGDFSDEVKAKKSEKKLKEKLAVCQKEKLEYLEMSQRLKADYLNLKKTEEVARTEAIKFAKTDLLLDLISLADNFEMAFANKEAWESVSANWRQGIEYIYSKLEGVLKQNGLQVENPIGAEFDPTKHTAIESVEVDSKKDDNKILAVIEKGYILNDKVIRPAKVKVGLYSLKK